MDAFFRTAGCLQGSYLSWLTCPSCTGGAAIDLFGPAEVREGLREFEDWLGSATKVSWSAMPLQRQATSMTYEIALVRARRRQRVHDMQARGA